MLTDGGFVGGGARDPLNTAAVGTVAHCHGGIMNAPSPPPPPGTPPSSPPPLSVGGHPTPPSTSGGCPPSKGAHVHTPGVATGIPHPRLNSITPQIATDQSIILKPSPSRPSQPTSPHPLHTPTPSRTGPMRCAGPQDLWNQYSYDDLPEENIGGLEKDVCGACPAVPGRGAGARAVPARVCVCGCAGEGLSMGLSVVPRPLWGALDRGRCVGRGRAARCPPPPPRQRPGPLAGQRRCRSGGVP